MIQSLKSSLSIKKSSSQLGKPTIDVQAQAQASQAQALAELRALLPPDVEEKLINGGEEGLTEFTLLRWLRARKWNVQNTARDLIAHAQWRIEYVPGGRILESEIDKELAHNKCFLLGEDKLHRPVILLKAERHLPEDAEQNKRYLCYCLDAAATSIDLTRNPSGKAVGIFELQGFAYKNCDLAALKNVFDTLQNHYVERLGQLYLYCAPAVFKGLWNCVYPFIDPVTREKVKFVYKEDGEAELDKMFAKEILPPELGGTAKLVPLQESVAKIYAQHSVPAQANGQANGVQAVAAADRAAA